MPTESNTSSEVGQTGVNRGAKPVIKSFGHNEVRSLIARETPRERMVRVVMTIQKKRKKR